jgi:hypothetical protein
MSEQIVKIGGGTSDFVIPTTILFGNKAISENPERAKHQVHLGDKFKIAGTVVKTEYINWQAIKAGAHDLRVVSYTTAKALPSGDAQFCLVLRDATINEQAQGEDEQFELMTYISSGKKLEEAGVVTGSRIIVEYLGKKPLRKKNPATGKWEDDKTKTIHDFSFSKVVDSEVGDENVSAEDFASVGSEEAKSEEAAPAAEASEASEDLKLEIYSIAAEKFGLSDENEATVRIVAETGLPITAENLAAIKAKLLASE